MNRIVLMVIRNFWKVPGAYLKVCRYARHTNEYGEEEKYRHIQYIFRTAIRSGNIDLKVYGQENIPKENGFMQIIRGCLILWRLLRPVTILLGWY